MAEQKSKDEQVQDAIRELSETKSTLDVQNWVKKHKMVGYGNLAKIIRDHNFLPLAQVEVKKEEIPVSL